MKYFDLFPNILVPSYNSDRTSSNDFVTATNIFKRGKIREDFFESTVAFTQYYIEGDDRPDNVAKELYDDQNLDWVVLISNNVISVRDEWPMSQYDLQRYLSNKYTPEQLSAPKFYRTKEIRDLFGKLLLQKDQVVDSDFVFNYYDGEFLQTKSGSNVLTSVSHYEHEIEKNDAKRSIYTLRKEYLNVIIEDMDEIMTYTNSSQFVNSRVKKGDNLRILSPR